MSEKCRERNRMERRSRKDEMRQNVSLLESFIRALNVFVTGNALQCLQLDTAIPVRPLPV